jgi:hypothetical protein
MKHSIRTKFTLGMIFLFLIILVLSIFSGFYMNKLSQKTSAILKENFLSVVYAREMLEGIGEINHLILTGYLSNTNSDSLKISKMISLVSSSLQSEKKNITEPGEDKLVADIETNYNEYRDVVTKYIKSPGLSTAIIYIQNKSGELSGQLSLLSQINGKALEVKTADAKSSSKSALTRMTILATLCFLIGMSFTFSFASYFNQRFFQLYNGIKEIGSSNYNKRLYFEGKDEFFEISLVINEMAEKLKNNKQKLSLPLQEDLGNNISATDVDELKKMLFRIKSMEEQAKELLSRVEKNS